MKYRLRTMVIIASFFMILTPSESYAAGLNPYCLGASGKFSAQYWPGGTIDVACAGDTGSGGCTGGITTLSPGQSYDFNNCTCDPYGTWGDNGTTGLKGGCIWIGRDLRIEQQANGNRLVKGDTTLPSGCKLQQSNPIACGGNGTTINASFTIVCAAPPPTPTPTKAPTPTPTRIPTPTPTRKPTPTPTRVPTATPTPTRVPPTPTPTRKPTPTATPIPKATTFSLTLFMHGIGNSGDNANPNQHSLSNKNPLHKTRPVQVAVYDNKDQQILNRGGTVTYNNVNGNFVGSIDMGTALPSGSYIVRVTSPQYLTKRIPGFVTISSGKDNVIPTTTLTTGDINGDNVISILDYNILLGCYSDFGPAISCTEDQKRLSDLTDEGNINQFDYNLLLRDFSVQLGD